MPKRKRRWIVTAAVCLAVLAVPLVLWISLTHEPEFYRKALEPAAPELRQAEAKRFVSQSLQLRNDIANEARWEASFTDVQVNAWLAEDLMTHFADLVPPGVHDPRVAFELDRVELAFGLDQGPIRSVIVVTARVAVPRENEVALTLEGIRAGLLPVPFDSVVGRLASWAEARGLDVAWSDDGGHPVATVRYTPASGRRDVVLERLHLANGSVRLSGRTGRGREAIADPALPDRRILQMAFPRRNAQRPPGSGVAL